MTQCLLVWGCTSGQVVGKIGETFGVSNLALDTEAWATSQVVVSGYVLPGLQVKYGVGSLTPGDAHVTLSPDASYIWKQCLA
jgi:translocation and assembly module TamB